MAGGLVRRCGEVECLSFESQCEFVSLDCVFSAAEDDVRSIFRGFRALCARVD
jgi:hypothetical protein